MAGCIALTLGLHQPSKAVEILRWERLPLTVRLVVGQERVVFLDRNVRVGLPDNLGDRLRVQSAGGALYLRASAPLQSTRLQLQDAETGGLVLVDVIAAPETSNATSLEPIRIIDATRSVTEARADNGAQPSQRALDTPIPVVLTRYAAQSLYAPLRTVEPLQGILSVPLREKLSLDTLLPGLAVRAKALAAWRLEDYWVTAVRLTHTAKTWLTLDPRALQGDFVAATFQHSALGPVGESTDTTVVYLITRRHGVVEALLPAAVSPVDASVTTTSAVREGGQREK